VAANPATWLKVIRRSRILEDSAAASVVAIACGSRSGSVAVTVTNREITQTPAPIASSAAACRARAWSWASRAVSSRRFKALPVAIFASREHRARQAAEKLKAGTAWTDTGLVFTTEIGTPIDPANLRRAFRTLIKRAGPDKEPTPECPKPGQWHPNEMRHSACSYMDAMGVAPKRVASILGHEGTWTTETVYIYTVRRSST